MNMNSLVVSDPLTSSRCEYLLLWAWWKEHQRDHNNKLQRKVLDRQSLLLSSFVQTLQVACDCPNADFLNRDRPIGPPSPTRQTNPSRRSADYSGNSSLPETWLPVLHCLDPLPHLSGLMADAEFRPLEMANNAFESGRSPIHQHFGPSSFVSLFQRHHRTVRGKVGG